MTQRPPWRRLAGPAAMSAAMLAVLLSLGVWQVHRLRWKETLLAAISAAEAAPAVPLPAAPTQFEKVSVTGVFGPGAVRYGADVRDAPDGAPVLGSFVIAPLLRPGAAPVLVERGWAPDGATVPAPAGQVTVVGYVRRPDHAGLFSARDDAAAGRFYTLDPGPIGAALRVRPAPFVLVALGPAGPALPQPAEALPRPSNNHFQYALTWFGLAAVLVMVFGQYAWKVARA